jgi:hypothetical protein
MGAMTAGVGSRTGYSALVHVPLVLVLVCLVIGPEALYPSVSEPSAAPLNVNSTPDVTRVGWDGTGAGRLGGA